MTLQEHLEEKFGVSASESPSFEECLDGLAESLGVEVPPQLKEITKRVDEGPRHDSYPDEDFAINPLPPGYSKEGIVGSVREYYEQRSNRYDSKSSKLDDWAVLQFVTLENRRFHVTLSVGPTFTQGKEQLLVIVQPHQDYRLN